MINFAIICDIIADLCFLGVLYFIFVELVVMKKCLESMQNFFEGKANKG
jgi:hypothetical protein